MDQSLHTPRRANISLLLISAIVTLICLFSHLGAIGFVGPDEPRYAWIARAMATTGDWITPRLYGRPWFEKPALYYWAAAIGFRLHLPAEWAARLPSAFAALAAALAMGWLGWKHYRDEISFAPRPALLAPLLFSTSVAAIGFARAATPDMLFSASIALAMACAASILCEAGVLRGGPDTPHGKSHADGGLLVLFGAFLGLGVLAKGPAAVILAGGAIGLWALTTRHWRAAFRLGHPFAIFAFCIVALPWYVLCALRNPGFLRIFIFEHNFERYLTPLFQHQQPFWFFGPILLLALLPWTALLIPTAAEGIRLWREKSWNRSPGLFFACWAFFPVLFFSFSQSKLPSYILPAIPPLALTLSVVLSRAIKKMPLPRGWVLVLIGGTWMAMGVAAFDMTSRLPESARDDPGKIIVFCAGIAVAGGIAVAVLRYFRVRSALLLSLLLATLFVEVAGFRILPGLDPSLSARPTAVFLHGDLHPDRIFEYHLKRSWTFGLAFYLGRELPEWSPADPEPALVLTSPEGLKEIRRLGRTQGELQEQFPSILFAPVGPVPR